jgi:hypothetical protein
MFIFLSNKHNNLPNINNELYASKQVIRIITLFYSYKIRAE